MTRRVITSAVTMVVLVVLLIFGAVWGWNSLFAPLPQEPTVAGEPEETCAPQTIGPRSPLRTEQVRISVFNAGSRSGLAGQTLDALVDRGFLPGDIGNAPEGLTVRKVQVWAESRNDPRARLVARQFGKNVRVKASDEDLGAGVDVVVGDRFRQLVKAPRQIRVQEREEFCVPVEPTEPAG